MSASTPTLTIEYAEPKNNKERLYKMEYPIDDSVYPTKAYIVINGVEYLIIIHY